MPAGGNCRRVKCPAANRSGGKLSHSGKYPGKHPGKCPGRYAGLSLQVSTCSDYALCMPPWLTHIHTDNL